MNRQTVTVPEVEAVDARAVAKILNPALFSHDKVEAHRAASPHTVTSARIGAVDEVRKVLDAAALATREKAPKVEQEPCNHEAYLVDSALQPTRCADCGQALDLTHPAPDALRVAVEALESIKTEANRTEGKWQHMKRVIALNCDQALAALQAKQGAK